MRRTKAEVYLHLVWATRDRMPSITPEIERCVHRCIEGEARALGCDVLAVGGTTDHLHVVLKLPTTVAIAALAQQVKGVSSRLVHDEFPGNGSFRWQEGYGVFSLSRRHVETAIAYVNSQSEHHAAGTTRARWEETDEEIDDITHPASPR